MQSEPAIIQTERIGTIYVIKRESILWQRRIWKHMDLGRSGEK